MSSRHTQRALGALLITSLWLSGCGAASHRVLAGVSDPSAFSRLSQGLVGSWRTSTGTRVDYVLVSNETALLETWTSASGRQTVTVYHPDLDEVRLTHYCAQGNQARLVLTDAAPSRFRFEREGVTNRLPGQSVLTALELRLGEALDRIETYVDEAGRAEVSELHFERVAPADAPTSAIRAE